MSNPKRRRKRRNRPNPIGQRLLMIFIFLIMAYMMWTTRTNQPVTVPDGNIWVHFIDVGQGDSILIQSTYNAVLIDAGVPAAGPVVANYIESLGISTIDFVVATHPHNDHIGGLPAVLDRFEVFEVWAPDRAHDTAAFERFLDAVDRNNLEITTITAGDTLSAGIIHMTALAPVRSGYANMNDYSIVMYLQFGHTSFMFTGDAEAVSENDMLESGRNLRASVLQAGHHGSRTSTTEAFLTAVAPQAVVISVGAGNQFGHPHPEVLERLERHGVMILRTDELGTIVMMTDGEYVSWDG